MCPEWTSEWEWRPQSSSNSPSLTWLGFEGMLLAGKTNVSPGERLNQGHASEQGLGTSQQCVHYGKLQGHLRPC